jgi:hypothetical protein
MAVIYRTRERPPTWREFNPKPLHPTLIPFSYLNWAGEWIAYEVSRWSIVEVLDYAGSLSILLGVFFYYTGAGDRLKQKHYQAWQVINTAQGKGGSGGRIDALQELNEDGVPLVGVDVADAFLQEIRLIKADLRRSELSGTDLKRSILASSNLEGAILRHANIRGGDCTACDLNDANFFDADLNGANLCDADVTDANFEQADLRNAQLDGLRNWQNIASIAGADIHGVSHAPEGFVTWAKDHGAMDIADDDEWNQSIQAMNRAATTMQSH